MVTRSRREEVLLAVVVHDDVRVRRGSGRRRRGNAVQVDNVVVAAVVPVVGVGGRGHDLLEDHV